MLRAAPATRGTAARHATSGRCAARTWSHHNSSPPVDVAAAGVAGSRRDNTREGGERDEASLAPGQVQKRRMEDLKPFVAIQRVQLPPGKGEPASRKRALHGWWQHHS